MATTNTRTCIACGVPKPLSAFLQITARGTMYGNICSTCRSAGIKEPTRGLAAEEGRGTSRTGVTIGAKERVHQEKEQKREIKELKDKEGKEKKHREEIKSEKLERGELLEKEEKERRTDYIESKKTFFTTPAKQPPATKQPGTAERRPLDAAQLIERMEREKASEKEQKKRTTFDLSSGGSTVDQPSTGMTKFENEVMRAFRTWLGGSAALGFKQPAKSEAGKTGEKTPGQDPLEKAADDLWGNKNRGPSSKR